MDTSVFESAFEACFVKMLNGESLVCAQTGASIVAHPARVTTIILDVRDLLLSVYQVLRAESVIGATSRHAWKHSQARFEYREGVHMDTCRDAIVLLLPR